MHSAGSMINTSPYLSNSFPEIGLTIVKAIAYTRKNVPGFTSIDDANSGKNVVMPPYANDKKNTTIVMDRTDFSNNCIFPFSFCGVNGIFVINDNKTAIKDKRVANKKRP